MAASDLFKADMDALVAGAFSVEVEVKRMGEPWRKVRAIVDDDHGRKDVSDLRPSDPIRVFFSRSDVAGVTVGGDIVRVDGKEYRIEEIIDSDDGALEVSCSR